MPQNRFDIRYVHIPFINFNALLELLSDKLLSVGEIDFYGSIDNDRRYALQLLMIAHLL